MAVQRTKNGVKRAVLTSLLLFLFIAISLVGWSFFSAPRLNPSRLNVAPADYTYSFNPGAASNPSSSQMGYLSDPSGITGTPAATKTASPTDPNKPQNLLPANRTKQDNKAPAPTVATALPVSGDLASWNNPVLPTPTAAAPKSLTNLANGTPSASTPNKAAIPNQPRYTSALEVVGPPEGRIGMRGAEFVDSKGVRYFAAGVNYEGYTDRAWSMWNNDRFDPNLIDQSFTLAETGGYNTVRIFVQTALRDDILANNWSKFDKVVELAKKHNLRLLVTFNDYYEPNISKLVEIDSLVARHFANSEVIFGYDLRNEPQFGELASAIYPADRKPLMQTDLMIRTYGERISQIDAENWRRGAGSKVIPGHLDSYQGYIFANLLRYHEEMMKDAENWTTRNGLLTIMDYFDSQEGQKWRSFIDGMSQMLQVYVELRQGAIQAADPNRPVTIGWNRPDMASLASNRLLGFVSYHRFAGSQAGGLAETLSMLDYLKNNFPGKPIVLEEFGYSNWDLWSQQTVPLLKSASYETSIWLFLYGRGYAGGFKWMLHNFTLGASPYENNFGLTDDNTQPKPSYYSARSVLNMVAKNRTPIGDFGRLESFDGNTIHYVWGSSNALFGNSKEFQDSRVKITQMEQAPWAIWWPNSGQGEVYFNTTVAAQVMLDLRAIFPTWSSGMKATLLTDNKEGLTSFNQPNETTMYFNAQPGQLYTIRVPVKPAAFSRATQLNLSNSTYFPETGHNLSNIFKRYWERNGGLRMFGYPISEEFLENGLTVQYFERAKFENHPEHSGTPNEVQLGLLGRVVAAGRQESGEKPFQTSAPFNSTATEIYFPETGHSLRGGFKAYWEKNGGLPVFGYPISEEFLEVNPTDGKPYIVQYFERNRFEWHPNFSGTPNEFQLGLLGLQIVRERGWMN